MTTGQAKNVLIFQCQRGALFRRVVSWKDAAANPVPLTGYRIRMPIMIGERVIFEPSTLNAKITVSPDGLSAVLALNGSDTNLLPPGNVSYRWLILPPGAAEVEEDTLFYGLFQVS